MDIICTSNRQNAPSYEGLGEIEWAVIVGLSAFRFSRRIGGFSMATEIAQACTVEWGGTFLNDRGLSRSSFIALALMQFGIVLLKFTERLGPPLDVMLPKDPL